MCQVTPKTNQIDRDLRAVRETMGDRHVLSRKQERLTRPMTGQELAARWREMNRTARGVA